MVTWKARFLQEMVQTEATKQGFCAKSGEEDFRWGREMGRYLLASEGLLESWEGLELLLSQAGLGVPCLEGLGWKGRSQSSSKARSQAHSAVSEAGRAFPFLWLSICSCKGPRPAAPREPRLWQSCRRACGGL